MDPVIKPFFIRRRELSVYHNCILWGSRIFVPEPGRSAVIAELHEGHPGMSKMKALSRMYVWWPGIDVDIEKSVRSCQACQAEQAVSPVVLLTPWMWPTRPWVRLHIDFA